MYTPLNYDFKESEIPITITTEGAKKGFFDGISISCLKTRYKI